MSYLLLLDVVLLSELSSSEVDVFLVDVELLFFEVDSLRRVLAPLPIPLLLGLGLVLAPLPMPLLLWLLVPGRVLTLPLLFEFGLALAPLPMPLLLWLLFPGRVLTLPLLLELGLVVAPLPIPLLPFLLFGRDEVLGRTDTEPKSERLLLWYVRLFLTLWLFSV